jgi:phospholipid transport system substrate-binding protein
MDIPQIFRRSHLLWPSLFLIWILNILALEANASPAVKKNPFDNIDEMTQELLVIIQRHKDQYPKSEAEYFSDLNNLMTGFVDFDFVAKKVMGRYARAANYNQRTQFVAAFRRGLVETYGRGLMSYGDEEILLVNRQQLREDERRVLVKQEIRGEAAVYPLHYLMYRKKSTGKWNIVNVTLNGINLSKTFASQFANAARKSSGNIDLVIDNWLSGGK